MMDILIYAFTGAVAIAAALAAIAIWAPRPTRVRIAAVLVTALFVPVVYLQFAEMLSKPKPMSFEWYERNEPRATVLGVSLYEGKSIYLWLHIPGSVEPRSYVVPWNQQLAEKLEDAVTSAAGSDSTVVLDNPFHRRSNQELGDLNVDILPPDIPPMKRPPPPARIFNPREPEGQSI